MTASCENQKCLLDAQGNIRFFMEDPENPQFIPDVDQPKEFYWCKDCGGCVGKSIKREYPTDPELFGKPIEKSEASLPVMPGISSQFHEFMGIA